MTRCLYRPVGLHELALIWDSGCRAFPPRLPHQPIFYPVANAEYAHQIARDWNTPDEASGYCGFVTRFAVDASYLSQFEAKTVGAKMHVEYWIPAESLDEFNRAIEGGVHADAAYFGPAFAGHIPGQGDWKGKNAAEQFLRLWQIYDTDRKDLVAEVCENAKAVFLNYLFWKQADWTARLSARQHFDLLASIAAAWNSGGHACSLPGSIR